MQTPPLLDRFVHPSWVHFFRCTMPMANPIIIRLFRASFVTALSLWHHAYGKPHDALVEKEMQPLMWRQILIRFWHKQYLMIEWWEIEGWHHWTLCKQVPLVARRSVGWCRSEWPDTHIECTWEAVMYCTHHQVNNAVDKNLKVGPRNKVLIW